MKKICLFVDENNSDNINESNPASLYSISLLMVVLNLIKKLINDNKRTKETIFQEILSLKIPKLIKDDIIFSFFSNPARRIYINSSNCTVVVCKNHNIIFIDHRLGINTNIFIAQIQFHCDCKVLDTCTHFNQINSLNVLKQFVSPNYLLNSSCLYHLLIITDAIKRELRLNMYPFCEC